MHTPKIRYVNLFVTDLPRAVNFYRKLLGAEPEVDDAEFGYASFRVDGFGLGLARVEPGDPLTGRHTGVGFAVPDLDAAHLALVEAGVTFAMAPARQPWGGYMAMFEDPDGNVSYLDQLPEG